MPGSIPGSPTSPSKLFKYLGSSQKKRLWSLIFDTNDRARESQIGCDFRMAEFVFHSALKSH
ncbi:MAG: hypothetical protein OXF74_14155, partial [Rhodobacteraceae bacterium]|nr:hypothetical protein [Paracoccaceae bacterium]